jgi:hypothetical protein
LFVILCRYHKKIVKILLVNQSKSDCLLNNCELFINDVVLFAVNTQAVVLLSLEIEFFCIFCDLVPLGAKTEDTDEKDTIPTLTSNRSAIQMGLLNI